MSNIVSVYPNTEGEQPVPYTFSYPPHYPSAVPPPSQENFDKLPTYEQIIQGIPEANNVNIVNNGPATLPVTIASQGLTNPMKTPT